MSKIALVYAGGTIGMQPNGLNESLAPPENEKDFEQACTSITSNFSERTGTDIDFIFFDKKDSTDRAPDDWQKLAELIQERREEYAGILVAHGTDTLAHTASALSFGFVNPDAPGATSLPMPLVLTAAQKPVYDQQGDGAFNLSNGLLTVTEMITQDIKRVAISSWENVFLGVRAMKMHDHDYSAFASPAAQPIGHISSVGVQMSRLLTPLNKGFGHGSPHFSYGVNGLELSPSTSEGAISALCEMEHTKVLVLKTLGEGNVPERLIGEIREQAEQGKIIVLVSPFAGGSVGNSVYELGAQAIQAGAIPAGDMVPPAVDAKCSWLVGNGIVDKDEFADRLVTNYVGEITNGAH